MGASRESRCVTKVFVWGWVGCEKANRDVAGKEMEGVRLGIQKTKRQKLLQNVSQCIVVSYSF